MLLLSGAPPCAASPPRSSRSPPAAPTPARLAVPPVAGDGERIASAFATVEVLDVSLPAYAEGEEIYVQARRRAGRGRGRGLGRRPGPRA